MSEEAVIDAPVSTPAADSAPVESPAAATVAETPVAPSAPSTPAAPRDPEAALREAVGKQMEKVPGFQSKPEEKPVAAPAKTPEQIAAEKAAADAGKTPEQI